MSITNRSKPNRPCDPKRRVRVVVSVGRFRGAIEAATRRQAPLGRGERQEESLIRQ